MFDLTAYNLQVVFSVCGIILALVFYRLLNSKKLLVLLSLFLTFRYLTWRALYTLNYASRTSLILSIILLLAEIYGFIQIILFFLQSSKTTNPIAPQINIEDLPSIDVFIPIYTEPKEILYRTIIGCQAMDYPANKKKIYVLDDSGRQEIKELAESLDCTYLSRQERKYGKGGNLNFGLKHSTGECIAFFDCDQITVRSFLMETVAFFQDPKVAFVQTPQHFYNPDIFQKNLKVKAELAQEQDLFFHLIQPGRDYYNSAIFCGSGGIFKRSALDDIGGFTQYAVIEDLPTSLELHAKGYKSVYLNKDLSAGLSPESCKGYIGQRKRWTKAGVQIFLFNNPLFKKGLNFKQRINYFATIYYFFHGIPRIIYLTWPLIYLFFNIPPIMAHIPSLFIFFLSHYIPSVIAINIVARRYRNPFFNDVYDTIMSFPIAGAVFSILFHPKKQDISVTPKGEHYKEGPISYSAYPHLITLIVLLIGVGIGLYRIFPGNFVYYFKHEPHLLICLFWALYNVIVLLVAVISARELPQRRGLIRTNRRLDCKIKHLGEWIGASTKDISETGCSLQLAKPITLKEPQVFLQIAGNPGSTGQIKCRVTRYDRDEEGEFNLGLEFIDLKENDRKQIVRQIYSNLYSWQHDHLETQNMWKEFSVFISTPVRAFIKEKCLRRVNPRFKLSLSCEVMFNDLVYEGTAKNISISGLTIEIKEKIILPLQMNIAIKREDHAIMLPVTVVWERHKNKITTCGVEFVTPYQGGYIWEKLGF